MNRPGIELWKWAGWCALAVSLLSVYPQVVWVSVGGESHFEFLDLHPDEKRERFYKYLYYTGIDGSRLEKELGQPMSAFAASAFGLELVIARSVGFGQANHC